MRVRDTLSGFFLCRADVALHVLQARPWLHIVAANTGESGHQQAGNLWRNSGAQPFCNLKLRPTAIVSMAADGAISSDGNNPFTGRFFRPNLYQFTKQSDLATGNYVVALGKRV